MTATHLGPLREKYLELLRLREEHRGGSAADPRARLAALAARFPGALRQIDRLTMDTIEARLFALDRAIEKGAPAPRWARLEIAYHGRMRATLRVKGAVRGVTDEAEALRCAAAAWAREADEPRERLDSEALSQIRSPKSRRLHPMVLEAVAAAHGVDVSLVRDVLLGLSDDGDCA
jgi:hypothetical protein